MYIKFLIRGGNSLNLCRYIAGDAKRSEVLCSNGVRDWDYNLMASDFDTINAQRPTITKNLGHCIISWPIGEAPDDVTIQKVGEDYINQLLGKDIAYALVKHVDQQHLHAHICLSLIDLNGNYHKTNYIGLRSMKISQLLEKKYTFKKTTEKNIEKTNINALHKYDKTKYQLHNNIKKVLKQSSNFIEFRENLEKTGIHVQLKYKSGSDSQIQGISFKLGETGFAYKGSSLDRSLSFQNITKTFDNNIHQNKSTIIANITQTESIGISTPKRYIGGLFSGFANGYVAPQQSSKKSANDEDNDDDSEEAKRRRKKKRSLNI